MKNRFIFFVAVLLFINTNCFNIKAEEFVFAFRATCSTLPKKESERWCEALSSKIIGNDSKITENYSKNTKI